MGDLTRNFSAREFRCHHCGREGIDLRLVSALQELRDHVGKPITVTSGYRCPEHPLSKSRPASQHVLGLAADIRIHGMEDALEMFEAAETVPAFLGGGIGLYPWENFVHVDVRGYRARWGFIGNKQVSLDAAIHEMRLIRMRRRPT